MKGPRVDLAAIFVGLLFLAVACVVAVDASSTWDLSPTLLWPAAFISWGMTLLLRALPAGPRSDKRNAASGPEQTASHGRTSP